ncbi:hypothetical protein FSARC_7241 [Fusarium sarcochroum]|uniref:Alcohol dehydrogenase n=1 Tax=Fusarium sarcochroum TaxID=1208366 RepID=A0A8H4TVH7_9HYPO|nr:hypothetical protein FSARC_7241 [Fusarium sarcochroum]
MPPADTQAQRVAVALVVATANGGFEPREVYLGEVRSNEILIRMVATGICHTDFSGQNGTIPVPMPVILGHEGAGVVEEVGAQVKHVQVGDHVLLSFPACETCTSCRKGQPAHCEEGPRLIFGGARLDNSTPFSLADGQRVHSFFGQSSFSSRSIVNGYCATSIDKDLPLSVLCPFGCSIQTGAGTVLNILSPTVDSSVVVYGAGSVGLAGIIAAANLTPATKIIAVDICDEKLLLAQRLGATHAINSSKEDVVRAIRHLTNGDGSSHAFDTTGIKAVIENMFEASANGARIASVASPPKGEPIHIEVSTWIGRGLVYSAVSQGSAVPRLVSARRKLNIPCVNLLILMYRHKFLPALVEFWKQGRLPVDEMVTEYSWKDFAKMQEDVRQGVCVKPVLIWDL